MVQFIIFNLTQNIANHLHIGKMWNLKLFFMVANSGRIHKGENLRKHGFSLSW
jgi:hypothetical protein